MLLERFKSSFALLLILIALSPAGAAEPEVVDSTKRVHHRQELYVEKEGQATYHAVLDYGPTRWFLRQNWLLFPEQDPDSPFTELRPPRQPAEQISDVVAPGETTVGFSSPCLWFGPVSLEGGLAALERPLEQTPFSGSWDAESGTALMVSREPPTRRGVGGALGPASFHHFRTEELRRGAGVLSSGSPQEPGLWMELIASHDQPLKPSDMSEEPWFLDEPPRVAEEGFHGALRGGINGGQLEQGMLIASSGTRLDPPGVALVSATRLARRPWGFSFALVEPGYRDGSLKLLAPGVSGVLMRRPGATRGHSLGGSLSGKRSDSTGAQREGAVGGELELDWKWRLRKRGEVEPRWVLELSVERQKTLPAAEATLGLGAAARPELCLGRQGGRWSLRVVVPAAVEQERKTEGRAETTVGYGVDLSLGLGPLALSPSWSVEREFGQQPLHSPKLSLRVSWGEKCRAQLGLRAGVSKPLSWEDLTSKSIYDEALEGALFFRVNG